jgi:hypothetical protein
LWIEDRGSWIEEAASSCGWDILSQVVLGASCSKFCDAKEEASAPSLHRTDLCGETPLPKKKSPKPQFLKSVPSVVKIFQKIRLPIEAAS